MLHMLAGATKSKGLNVAGIVGPWLSARFLLLVYRGKILENISDSMHLFHNTD